MRVAFTSFPQKAIFCGMILLLESFVLSVFSFVGLVQGFHLGLTIMRSMLGIAGHSLSSKIELPVQGGLNAYCRDPFKNSDTKVVCLNSLRVVVLGVYFGLKPQKTDGRK